MVRPSRLACCSNHGTFSVGFCAITALTTEFAALHFPNMLAHHTHTNCPPLSRMSFQLSQFAGCLGMPLFLASFSSSSAGELTARGLLRQFPIKDLRMIGFYVVLSLLVSGSTALSTASLYYVRCRATTLPSPPATFLREECDSQRLYCDRSGRLVEPIP